MKSNACYYEVLGVTKTASLDEIRKAYKFKALQLHPDKNSHRLEEATKEFAHLQQCYSVLSDPHERRWYDSHKDAILRSAAGGKMSTTVEEDDAFDLMPFFNTSAFKGFDDGPKGFFTVYRTVFADIEAEERRLYQNLRQQSENNRMLSSFQSSASFTTFGSSSTSFIPTLKDFYQKWCHFCTLRTFSSMDKYKPSDAENRYQRRQLEKENKKLRDSEKKEYNETVKALAQFLKKRDPRVIQFQKRCKDEEEKKLQEKKLKKSMNNVIDKQHQKESLMEEQSWAKIDENEYLKYFEIHMDFLEESGQPLEEEESYNQSQDIIDMKPSLESSKKMGQPSKPEEELICVSCNKSFKSESQWKNHEQSNKHKKLVLQIKRKLKKEEKLLNQMAKVDEHIIEESVSSENSFLEEDDDVASGQQEDSLRELPELSVDESFESISVSSLNENYEEIVREDKSMSNEDSDNSWIIDDLCSADDSSQEILANLEEKLDSLNLDDLLPDVENNIEKNNNLGPNQPSKTEKKKRRSGKQRQKQNTRRDLSCETCNQNFQSRNELFYHLKKFKHATFK